jgi:nitrate reductase NapAB chaperone NapD
MNLSSILVFTSPDNIQVLHNRLCALPGIEVHYQCHDTGRLVVIQEANDDEAEMDGLQRIKNLPHVMAAEMFYHLVDDGAAQQNNAGGTSL